MSFALIWVALTNFDWWTLMKYGGVLCNCICIYVYIKYLVSGHSSQNSSCPVHPWLPAPVSPCRSRRCQCRQIFSLGRQCACWVRHPTTLGIPGFLHRQCHFSTPACEPTGSAGPQSRTHLHHQPICLWFAGSKPQIPRPITNETVKSVLVLRKAWCSWSRNYTISGNICPRFFWIVWQGLQKITGTEENIYANTTP